MKTLTELIQNYQNGIPDSDSEILKRMEPLVKGYASRIHCMEREDSIQELYLTLLKTLPYLSSSSSEGECIRYMQTSVENRYRSLCRSCLSEPEKDDFDSCSVSLQAPDSFDDTYYDVTAYINSYPSDSVQRKILSMYFYQDKKRCPDCPETEAVPPVRQSDEEETNSQIYFRKQIKETPADHKFTVCRCSLSFHKISINAIPVPEMPFIKARFRYSVPDIFAG